MNAKQSVKAKKLLLRIRQSKEEEMKSQKSICEVKMVWQSLRWMKKTVAMVFQLKSVAVLREKASEMIGLKGEGQRLTE